MDVLHPTCAGLDIPKDTVVACVRRQTGRTVAYELRTFGTTTHALLGLVDWLTGHGGTHVAMESTGVFWKPVWHVLGDAFELLLANPQHIRNVPGRKSDVKDAQWIAELVAHGLSRGSFVPPPAVQALRDLTRTRTQLIREMARHTQRVQKTLQDANLKLTSMLSDISGKTGRAILAALVAGETDPERLAALAQGRLKAPRPELLAALQGHRTAHHRFLLQLHLTQIDGLEAAVREVEARLGEALSPFQAAVDHLTTMPGVGDTVARVIVAEIGIDMTRYPTAGHLISWAGLCPRLHESAGKPRSTRTRPGAPWLKTILVQAAWSAVKVKPSYLAAQFARVARRRGRKKAIVAVAASMLTAAYHMLKHGVDYRDLGAEPLTGRDRTKLARRLVQRLEHLGLAVEIRPAA